MNSNYTRLAALFISLMPEAVNTLTFISRHVPFCYSGNIWSWANNSKVLQQRNWCENSFQVSVVLSSLLTADNC